MIADPNFRLDAPPSLARDRELPPSAPAAEPSNLEEPHWLEDEEETERPRWFGLGVSVLLHMLVIGAPVFGWFLYETPRGKPIPVAMTGLQNGGQVAPTGNGSTEPKATTDVLPTGLTTSAAAAPSPATSPTETSPAQPTAETQPAPTPAAAMATPAQPAAPEQTAATETTDQTAVAEPPIPREPPLVPRVRHRSAAPTMYRTVTSRDSDSSLPPSHDPLLAWPPRAPVLAPPTEPPADTASSESRDPLVGSQAEDAPAPDSRDPLIAPTR